MFLLIASIVAGLVALVIGGELLVRGASLMAAAMRISPLIIGLTVVAFGTSAPELGVSLQAALSGTADVALGNVVGSNILNVLFILGAAALVAPLIVSSQLVRLDVPLMIVASAAMWGMSLDGAISRIEGVVLFSGLIAYIIFCIRQSKSESPAVVDEFAQELPKVTPLTQSRFVQIALIVVGLGFLGLGSKLLVSGAVAIAQMWGVSQLIIGLTIVAAGTSLPELVTSVVASFKGERDIAVGNIVGSNLFNILAVLGLSSIIAPGGIAVSAAALRFDIPVMVAVTAICLPIFFTGIISRIAGGILLIYYVAYTAILILAETNPQLNQQFSWIVVYIVLPLSLLTILFSVVQSYKKPSPTVG